MSVHSSLVTKGILGRSRNVLTRYERILELRRAGRWEERPSAYGLPKVKVLKIKKRGKEKKKKEGEEEATEGTTNTDS